MDKAFLFMFLASLRICGSSPIQLPTSTTTPTKAPKVTTDSSTNKVTDQPSSTAAPPTKCPTSITTPDFSSLTKKYGVFPTKCGIQQHKSNTKGTQKLTNGIFPKSRRFKRVVGGDEAKKGQFPWQIAVLFNGHQYCGGAVVHSNWVVTASHCFNPYTSTDPKNWTIALGQHRKDSFNYTAQVTSITIHPCYRSMWFEGITDTPPMYDIAVLKLKTRLTFNSTVQPVCIMTPAIIFPWNETCYISGWGHTEWNGVQPVTLNFAMVPLVSHMDCNKPKSYNGTIHDTAVCAGYKKGQIDSCEYDSGGPLVCEKLGHYYVTGLVSWGHECARAHKYGVYSRMEMLTPWMVDVIGNEELATRNGG